MERNKFEKHIREQLQNRKIRPSAGAWEKVSHQLEAEAKPKTNRFFRAGIAAGFIGLLMVTTWYFNGMQPKSLPEMESVSTQEKKIDAQDRKSSAAKEIENGKVKEVLVNSENKAPLLINMGQAKATLPSSTEDIEPVGNIGLRESEVRVVEKVDPIEIKVADVLAQIEVIEREQSIVMTDAEVDSLLLNAQSELMAERMFPKTNNVDPKTLLTTVEEELDQSFRDQIFEKLKIGFEKVRTAVAQRNN